MTPAPALHLHLQISCGWFGFALQWTHREFLCQLIAGCARSSPDWLVCCFTNCRRPGSECKQRELTGNHIFESPTPGQENCGGDGSDITGCCPKVTLYTPLGCKHMSFCSVSFFIWNTLSYIKFLARWVYKSMLLHPDLFNLTAWVSKYWLWHSLHICQVCYRDMVAHPFPEFVENNNLAYPWPSF